MIVGDYLFDISLPHIPSRCHLVVQYSACHLAAYSAECVRLGCSLLSLQPTQGLLLDVAGSRYSHGDMGCR